MKSRLTLSDLLGEVACLRSLVLNMRLINIYDATSVGDGAAKDTFLLKFGEPDREKLVLLVESGVRIHCTRYGRDKPVLPCNFTMKLRKHIRGRRLTGISLIGLDRVLDLTFGSGAQEHHLIVELYDRGNVVLTDGSYTILSLLRGYTLEAEGAAAPGAGAAEGGAGGAAPATAPLQRVRVAVREVYSSESAGSNALLGAAHVAIAQRLSSFILGTTSAAAAAATEAPSAVADGSSSSSSSSSSSAPSPAAAPIMDPTSPTTPALAAQIAAFLADFAAVRLPAMAPKARKKLRLAGALCTKGSGLDLLGPTLLEHAAAAAGLPGGSAATLEALQQQPPGSSSAPLSAPLLRFAAHVRSIPSILRAIASQPTPSIALLEPAGEAAVGGGLSALLKAVGEGGAGSGGSSAAPAPVPVPVPTPAAAAAEQSALAISQLQGDLGAWKDLEARYRAAAPAAAAATATTPLPAAAAASSATGPSAADKEFAGVGEGEDLGLSTQAPPPLPFKVVDIAPFPFAHYTGPASMPLTRAAVQQALALTAAYPALASLSSELEWGAAAAAGAGAAAAAAGGSAAEQLPGTPASTKPPPRHLFATFPTFDAACDEHFSRCDLAKAEKAETAAKSAAERRVERIREGHAATITALEAAQAAAYRRGALVVENTALVEAACTVIRSALENSVPWLDLERMVEVERAGGNPVAGRIVSMDLAKGRVVLALVDEEAAAAERGERRRAGRRLRGLPEEGESEEGGEGEGESEEEGEEGEGEGGRSAAASAATAAAAAAAAAGGKKGGKKGKGSGASAPGSAAAALLAAFGPHASAIECDVYASAAANARAQYAVGKAAVEKAAKTGSATTAALRKAERTVAASEAHKAAGASAVKFLRTPRRPAWFERFLWFLTSEGLVVVAGRCAADNEALVKRYLRPQDAYVHADVHGAATVILRSPSSDPASGAFLLPRLGLSLQQAGVFCVCLSAAWASNSAAGAWWVQAEQVSKTAPTGEYLSTGSFMIRGRRNMLPVAKLELGYGVVFKVGEGSVGAHAGDRRLRDEEALAYVGERERERGVGGGEAPVAEEEGEEGGQEGEGGGEEGVEEGVEQQEVGEEGVAGEEEGGEEEEEEEEEEEGEEEEEEDSEVEDDEAEAEEGSEGEQAAEEAAAAEAQALSSAVAASLTLAPTTSTAAPLTPSPSPSPTAPAGSHSSATTATTAAAAGSEEDCIVVGAWAGNPTPTASGGGRPPRAGQQQQQQQKQGSGSSGGGGGSRQQQQQRGGGGKQVAVAAAAAAAAATTAALLAPSPAGKGPVRGKNTKAWKKKVSRYEEQDEEDRVVAMALLGHQAATRQAAAEAAAAAASSAPSAAAAAAAAASEEGASACSAAATAAPAAAAPAERRRKEPRQAAASVEEEEGLGGGGGGGAGGAGSSGDSHLVTSLVGQPLATDHLTHALPMLAPYSVILGACKYRVKLVPGPLKKGKGGQAALHHWSAMAASPVVGTARELELVKSITDAELVSSIVGDCRVVGEAVPGGRRR